MPSWAMRLLGLLTLFVGLSGFTSTVSTLLALTLGPVSSLVAQRAGAAFGWFLLLVNVADLGAYGALVGVSIAQLRSKEFRIPGQVLGAYCVVMGILQPGLEYVFLVRPGAATEGTLSMVGGAAVLVGYGAVLHWAARQNPEPSPTIGTRPRVDRGPKEASPARPAPAGRRAATNAPRHWPLVVVDRWMPEMPFYNQLGIVAALAEGLKVGEGGPRLALARSFVYDDGVLRVPILVDENGQRTAVFVYPEAGPDASAHYSGVRSALRRREGVSAVYYAPQALAPRAPSPVVEDLEISHFSKPDAERPPAEYAIWFHTPDDPRLEDSTALVHLDTWFEALDGYGHVLFSMLVEELGLAAAGEEGGERTVYALPIQPLMLPVDGPGDLALYLHASSDQGLWFAFDVHKTTAAERNRLLALLARLATRARGAIDHRHLPPHREGEGRSLYFWRRSRQDALDKEASGADALVRLGSILEAGVGRFRLAGASTAAERADASARAQPSEALVDFARQQLDRVFAGLGEREATGLDEGDEEPNLHPIVAVREGADVHSVTLHRFTEVEAVQACPSVVEDFGDVDAVALVCDGIAHLDEERFDAVHLRAQERGHEGSHLFVQRYRLGAGKPTLLGNWLLHGSDDTLLPRRPHATKDAPSPAVVAFAQEILETTVQWIRVGDESGSELYEEGQPLFSPALYLRIGSETHMRRFMMGNEIWAEGASRDELQSSEAVLVAFSSDRVAETNRESARRLRFRVQERGTSFSWIYEQPYDVPQIGRPFQAPGPLRLVRPAPSLFP